MKKFFKLILTVIAVATCALALSACGKSAFPPTEPPENGSDVTVTPPAIENPDGDDGTTVTPPESPDAPPNEPDPEEPPSTPAVKHTATFLFKNEVYDRREFLSDVSEIRFPEVPQIKHYNGEWQLIEKEGENLIYSAVYAPVTYFLSVLGEDGFLLQKIDYTVQTSLSELNKSLPPLPQKAHFTARWSDFTLFDEAATVRPEFTPVTYTVTFTDANGGIICLQTYDIESGKEQITEPPVPELDGYENGRWESYELNYENITVHPVYDKIPDPADTFTEGLIFTLNEAGDYEVTGYDGKETEVKIPSVYGGINVTAVAESAFYQKNVSKVIIAEGVLKLMPQAFYLCKLTEIKLPQTLEFIGKSAFNSCVNLKEITVPDSVTTVEAMAFAGCASLESAFIGSGVTELPKMAFVKCAKLQTVILASRETKIDNQTFSECPLFSGVTYSD